MYIAKDYQKHYQQKNLKLYSFRLNMNNKGDRELIDYLNTLDNKRRWIIQTLTYRMNFEKEKEFLKKSYDRGKQTDQED